MLVVFIYGCQMLGSTYQSLKQLSRLLIVTVIKVIISHGRIQNWNRRIHLTFLESKSLLEWNKIKSFKTRLRHFD